MYCWLLTALLLSGAETAPKVDPPETVIAAFYPQAGKADEVEALIWEEWETVRRLGLVANDVHHLYRGQSESGQTVLFDMFTWKDHATPDHAPPQVRAIWRKMNAALEKRNGEPHIEIVEVEERIRSRE